MQLLTSDVICLETTFGKMFERYLLNVKHGSWSICPKAKPDENHFSNEDRNYAGLVMRIFGTALFAIIVNAWQ